MNRRNFLSGLLGGTAAALAAASGLPVSIPVAAPLSFLDAPYGSFIPVTPDDYFLIVHPDNETALVDLLQGEIGHWEGMCWKTTYRSVVLNKEWIARLDPQQLELFA